MPTKYEVVVRPVVTEKSSAAYQERGEYTFQVHPEASKPQIREAIQSLFGVTVTGVWTMKKQGKEKRMGQNVGRRSSWKKAIVKLKDGDSIPIFEG
jgi:large subunit ribosomal protein L23